MNTYLSNDSHKGIVTSIIGTIIILLHCAAWLNANPGLDIIILTSVMMLQLFLIWLNDGSLLSILWAINFGQTVMLMVEAIIKFIQ